MGESKRIRADALGNNTADERQDLQTERDDLTR
jgi:hypothetical protein